MIIRRKTRWTNKPPVHAVVDRSHPSADGLIAAFTFPYPMLPVHNLAAPSARIGFTGDPLTRFGSVGTPFSFDPGTRFGGGIRCTSVTAGQFVTLGTDNGQFPQSQVTILIGIKKTDGTNRTTHALHIGTGTNLLELLVPFTDGKVYFDWGGGVEGTTRLSVAGLTKGDDAWVFTTGARGMEIWQNGLKRASNAATPTRTAASNSPFSIGENGLGADLAITSFVFAWDRQLQPSEIQHLSGKPYDLVAGQTPLDVSIASVVGVNDVMAAASGM